MFRPIYSRKKDEGYYTGGQTIVESGPALIRQVLLNTPYSLLRFKVQDTGIGTPPDQLERIVQTLEQVPGTAQATCTCHPFDELTPALRKRPDANFE